MRTAHIDMMTEKRTSEGGPGDTYITGFLPTPIALELARLYNTHASYYAYGKGNARLPIHHAQIKLLRTQKKKKSIHGKFNTVVLHYTLLVLVCYYYYFPCIDIHR